MRPALQWDTGDRIPRTCRILPGPFLGMWDSFHVWPETWSLIIYTFFVRYYRKQQTVESSCNTDFPSRHVPFICLPLPSPLLPLHCLLLAQGVIKATAGHWHDMTQWSQNANTRSLHWPATPHVSISKWWLIPPVRASECIGPEPSGPV